MSGQLIGIACICEHFYIELISFYKAHTLCECSSFCFSSAYTMFFARKGAIFFFDG